MIKEIDYSIPEKPYSEVRQQLTDENTIVYLVPSEWSMDDRTYVFSSITEISKCPVIDPLGKEAVVRLSIGEVIEKYPDAIIYPGARDHTKLQEIFSYIPF